MNLFLEVGQTALETTPVSRSFSLLLIHSSVFYFQLKLQSPNTEHVL